jgi:hypothetical protein
MGSSVVFPWQSHECSLTVTAAGGIEPTTSRPGAQPCLLGHAIAVEPLRPGIVNIGVMLNNEELFGQSHPHVLTQSQ